MPESYKNQNGQALLTSKHREAGQALLIVLLAMAVIATIVLSISSRSVSEVSVSSREEESLRAFSAAEAGVEKALVSGNVTTNPTVNGPLNVTGSMGTQEQVSQYNAQVTAFPNNTNQFIYPIDLLSGEAASIWLVTKDDDKISNCSATAPCFQGTDIELCWGEGATEDPAVEVTFVYINPSGDYTSARAAFDPDSTRIGTNKFSPPDSGTCTIEGKTFPHHKTVNLASIGVPQNTTSPGDKLKLMRVKLLYNTTVAKPFGVKSASTFPTQGKKVTSQGNSGVSTRKIDAYLMTPVVPHIFDAVIYSPVSIIK